MGAGKHDLLIFWNSLCPIAPDADNMGLKRNSVTCVDPIQKDIPDRLKGPDVPGLVVTSNGRKIDRGGWNVRRIQLLGDI